MLIIAAALAVEVQVGPGLQYETVNAALADPEATLLIVQPGTYDLGTDVSGRSVEIRGTSATDTVLTLDGELLLSGPTSLSLTDVTLTASGGTRIYGTTPDVTFAITNSVMQAAPPEEMPNDGERYPLFLVEQGTLVSTSTVWTGGSAYLGGTLIDAAAGASVVMQDSDITLSGAQREDAAPVVIRGGSSLDLQQSRVTDNNGLRGALRIAGTSVLTSAGSFFQRNYAAERGGAIYMNGSTADITGAVFEDNIAEPTLDTSLGGAIDAGGASDLTLSLTHVRRNSAYSGGGVACVGGTCELLDNTLTGNTATSLGAALLMSGNAGLALRNAVCSNTAAPSGGAIRLFNATVQFSNNLLNNNDGAGVSVGAGNAQIEHTLFMANRNGGLGAAVAGGAFNVRDSLFVSHEDPDNTFLVYSATPANATVSNNGFFENTVAVQPDISDFGGNVEADPMLHVWPPRRCALIDFRLRDGSPLIGEGSNNGTDIGAHSGPHSLYDAVDADEDGILAPYDCDDTDPTSTQPVRQYPNDADQDGWADAADPGEPFEGCPLRGWAEKRGDCDDTNAAIYPTAVEDLGGEDLDCDSYVDPAVRPERACSVAPSGLAGLWLGVLLFTRWRRSA